MAPTHSNDDVDHYMGPYERWVFRSELGRPFSFPAIAKGKGQHFTALIDSGAHEFTPPETLSVADPNSGEEREVKLRYPPLWSSNGAGRSITPVCFGDPSVDDGGLAQTLHAVCQLGPEEMQPRFRVNFPINPKAWSEFYIPNPTTAQWPGHRRSEKAPKAIIAVIDDGIPFANRAFLDAYGQSKINYCWLQSAEAAHDISAVPFGKEFTNREIDALRQIHGQDEDVLYVDAGAVNARLPELGTYLSRHTTHGAHVLSVAAGHGLGPRQALMDDDVHIIAVQLPNTIAWDTSGFGKEMYMLSALHYIFERARRICESYGVADDALPLVVNFSYGWSGSRHDGQSEMETAIEQLFTQRNTDANGNSRENSFLVMPTGNTFSDKLHARLSDGHFVDGAAEISWNLLPDDRTSSYLEIWFPEEVADGSFEISITPPKGIVLDSAGSISLTADPNLNEGDARQFQNLVIDGKIVGQLSVDKNRGTRWRCLIALVPTIEHSTGSRVAPIGRWSIGVAKSNALDPLPQNAAIELWVQRDDDPSELKTGGQQSYLSHALSKRTHLNRDEYPNELEVVRGYGSMNGVANSKSTIRVAGYDQTTGRPSHYSSAGALVRIGTTLNPTGAQTTVCAPSDRGPSRHGMLGGGSRSRSRSLLVGTSGAAPQVARQMVLNLAAGKGAFEGMGDTLQGINEDEQIRRTHIKARLGHKKLKVEVQ
ncbi:S8/S53 family peptidase [Cochlodiniinecator piscidefendens]|uniref:hypothetical protein n=1 Tax=Cochlodiniinecator piscidefendens TaxID=2715756 RepID=UPI0014094FCB|nr:hypothetical protein [Cochlodiniinecator piscidefendens]